MPRRLIPIILVAGLTALALLLPRDNARAAGPIVVEALTVSPNVLKPVEVQRGAEITIAVKISGGRAPYTLRWTSQDDKTPLCEAANCNPWSVNTSKLRQSAVGASLFFTIKDADGQAAGWNGTDGSVHSDFSVSIGGISGGGGVVTTPEKLPSTPLAAPSPTAAASAKTAAPAAPAAGELEDSGARFSSLNGQVETRPESCEKCWKLAKLETMLRRGDHIRTQEDSSAVIGFADLSTFVVKPETEVVVRTAAPNESKLKLVIGNIWANIKHMAKDGSMEIEMNQAVTSIKGTTFVLSETGGTSTLQVIEGSVEFTSTAMKQKATVNGGFSVAATKNGLGEVKPIDVKAVTAEWDAVRAKAETGKPPTGGRGQAASAAWYLSAPVLGAAAGAILVAVAGVVWLSRRRAA